MSERIDQVEKYYRPIEICNKIAAILFWCCAVLSISLYFIGQLPADWLMDLIHIGFIILVVIFSLISNLSSLILTPKAEEKRRKQLLSNSLGPSLIPEQTSAYYNNSLPPSVDRLGACIVENAFFGKSIVNEMVKRERLRTGFYVLLFFIALLNRNTELGLILILTQLVFSAEIIIFWIKLEFYRMRLNKVYEDMYTFFLQNKNSANPNGLAYILDSFASYEVAKSLASLKLSSKLFFKLNNTLTEEWTQIAKILKLNES